MPSTHTSRKRLEKQTPGENTTWGNFLNTNTIALVDECFGTVCVALTTSGDSMLSQDNGSTDEGRRSQLILTGAPTSNVRLYVPAAQGFYLVRNKMTGSYKVTLTNTGGTNGVDFSGSGSGAEQGIVFTDRTNVREIFRTVSAASFAVFTRGMIVPFFNSVGAVPTKWSLCDGTNGTPNLNDRFTLGTTSNSNVDTSGGGLSLSLVSSGEHTHVATSLALTSAHIPAHSHLLFTPESGYGDLLADNYQTVNYQRALGGSHDYFMLGLVTSEQPSLGLTNWAFTSSPEPHTHTVVSAALHDHSFTVTEARPPYHRTLFIMYTG